MVPDLVQCYTEMYNFLGERDHVKGGSLAGLRLRQLSPVQIRELTTDIYFEMARRRGLRKMPAPTLDYTRIEARHKMANLSNPTFRDLVVDMCSEFERRNEAVMI